MDDFDNIQIEESSTFNFFESELEFMFEENEYDDCSFEEYLDFTIEF